jgi:hypothetical protein
MFKIEVKTEDNEYGRKGATTKQRLYLEKWARAGAISCVVYSVGDVKYMLRNHTPFGEMFSIMKENSLDLPSVAIQKVKLSGRGKWYDVQNKRWVEISY